MAWTTPRSWVAGEVVTAALLNTHLRDNLNALGQWSTYTPTFTGGVGAAVGNGTLKGRYTRIGKTVWVQISFIFGSTSNAGDGTGWGFSLPSTVQSDALAVGSMRISDAGTGYWTGAAALTSTTVVGGVTNNTAGFVAAGAPITWAENDVIMLSLCYEEA